MEHEAPRPAGMSKTYAFALLFLTSLSLYLLYMQSFAQLTQSNLLTGVEFSGRTGIKFAEPTPNATGDALAVLGTMDAVSVPDPNHLVSSSKCRIPNLDAFNKDVRHLYKKETYSSCSKLPLLTYVTSDDDSAVLHVNETIADYYSPHGVSCCYSSVTRSKDKDNPDKSIKVSNCIDFHDNATIGEDFIVVDCKNAASNAQVYKNVHAVIKIKQKVRKKLAAKRSGRHLSVLCVGIDSVSRLNFIRLMPKTLAFFEKNNWIELKGYNKMGDNTFPNLMAILSGMNETQSYRKCKPTEVGGLDACDILWYNYRDLGFVTGYAEDESGINTFNFNKKGFRNDPTDYYFRPYVIAAEKQLKTSRLDDMTYCTGPETSGERILNLAQDFSGKFKDHPYFAFFWMNTFSHNKLNSLSRMDEKVLKFFQYLLEEEVLQNTIVLFFSDHGLRFGDIRYTTTGWLEERLPIFFILLPDWFKYDFPKKYHSLLVNQNRLTTPFDVYMMLQDVLVMSGKNYTVKQSPGCPKCKSLFEEAEAARSCEDASIQQHWCTCGGYVSISTNNATVKAASKYILSEIHETIDSFGHESQRCAKFKLKKIKTASISENGVNWYKNDTYLLIILQTSPEAMFESTVSVEQNGGSLTFKMQGGISRLDYYKWHSSCVDNSNLKKYCYCNR